MRRILFALLLAAQAAVAQNYSVNVENNTVGKYLTEVTYAPDSASRIEEYTTAGTRLDMPKPVLLFIPKTDATAVTVYYGEESDLSDALSVNALKRDAVVRIYNLAPGRKYYYSMVADDTEIAHGTIAVTGGCRMIYVPGVRNVRDLGGWTTTDGATIRYGKIYRGGELNGRNTASQADVDLLKALGIAAEIDLRQQDVDDGSGISAFGFESGDDGSFLFTDNSGCCERSHLVGAYWMQRYKREFEHIVKCLRADRPVYFHCVWGADRTGMLSFLLEGLLGVPYDQLMKDYELTSFYVPRKKDRIEFAFDFINGLSGQTLRDKFYTYFVKRLMVSADDVAFFRQAMLEGGIENGVDGPAATAGRPQGIYDLQGRRLSAGGKGLRIVVGQDGRVSKMLSE